MKYSLHSWLFFIAVLCISCEKDDSATAVSVSKITVNTPLTDQGSNWDIGSDADVFFQLESANTVLYKHASPFENMSSAKLPLTLEIPNSYQLPAIERNYIVSLYDYDSGSPDDFIGEIHFNPELYRQSRATKEVFTNNNVQIEVYFNWK